MLKQQKEISVEKLSAYRMTTEAIRSELGNWGEEYLRQRTGEQQYDCEMLYGEREGIVEWLHRRGIIGSKEYIYKAPAHFYPRHIQHPGEITNNYYFVKDIAAWKFFERKLDLWRELEGRRHYAEVKEREGQLGGNLREWEEEIARKVAIIGSKLKKLRSHEHNPFSKSSYSSKDKKTLREIEIEVGEKKEDDSDLTF